VDVVWRVDPVAKAVTESIPRLTAPSNHGEGIAVGEGAVWVNGPVTRIDLATNAPTPIDVPDALGGIAAGEGGVWTVDSFQGTLWRIDPQREVVTRTIDVGRAPLGVAVGAGSVWVANSSDGTVSRIDPTTNEVVETIEVGDTPRGVAVGEGFVWVAVS
jgi:YVTN family beta-propeller protein